MRRLLLPLLALLSLVGCATVPTVDGGKPKTILGIGGTGAKTNFQYHGRVGVSLYPAAMQAINCATNTPCTLTGPSGTGTGDPLWLASGKTNVDIATLFNMFGASSNLATNGVTTYADVVGLWSGTPSSSLCLGATGALEACSGGSGSTFQVNGTNLISQTPVNFENSPLTGGLTVQFTNPSAGNIQPLLNGWPSLVSSECLSNNGSALLWATCGTGVPGGSSFSIQYNNGGSFGGLLPGSVGTYCFNWSSLSAAPTLSTSCGTVSFASLTGGTNNSAAMVVGTGASIGPSGGGTVNANQVNGSTVPGSVSCLGSNSSSQLISGSCPGGISSVGGAGAISVSTVSGAATVSLVSGNGLTQSGGTLATSQGYRTVATASDTISCATDSGKFITYSDSAAVAISIPQATSGCGAGFGLTVENTSATGIDTITPTTSTIGGSGTLVIPPSMGCSIVSDGTNYQVGACTAYLIQVNSRGSGTTLTPECNAGAATTVNTFTATGNLTINLPTGCIDGQGVKLRIKFTASVTYTWNGGYHAGSTIGITSLPTASSSASGEDYLQFDDDTANSRFNYLALASF